jgi:hypothetical protein
MIILLSSEHVFELFKNLRTKGKRHEESFEVATLFVRKL